MDSALGAVITSLFCDGVITSVGLAVCLGPSRTARKRVISLVPRNLEANRKQRKNPFDFSTWFTGPSAPDKWGKGDPLTDDALGDREGLLAL